MTNRQSGRSRTRSQPRGRGDSRPVRDTAAISNAASVPASMAPSANRGLIPMRLPPGRIGISVRRARGVARGIVHRDFDLRFEGVGRVGCVRERDRQRGAALGIGVREVDLLAVRRETLALEPDPVPGARGTAQGRSRAAVFPCLRGPPPARRRESAPPPAARMAALTRSGRGWVRDRRPCGPARRRPHGTRPARSAARPDRPAPPRPRCPRPRRATA